MITFIAFVLTILGCVNWLMIGLLQYDYIAGFFGFQASMFSRIIYIIFGVAAAYLVIRVIVNKGNLKVWEKKKKKATNPEQSSQEQQPAQMQPAYANVEAGQEAIPQNNSNFQNNTQSNENQQTPKKKKWWQFWKRDKKKKKSKQNQQQVEDYPSVKTSSYHLPSQGEARTQPQQTPPIDIDITLNTTPQNFNEQPPQQQISQDNLFDEHFEK